MPGDRTRRARSIWRGGVALYVQAAVQFCGAPGPPAHYKQSPPAAAGSANGESAIENGASAVENCENAVENGESAVENNLKW